MSGGPLPIPDAERDVLAAEWVLGTLDAHTAAMVEQGLTSDPALADAVAAWERLLAPLADLAPVEAPPASLWQRIERQVLPDRTPAIQAASRPSWRGRLLAGWAFGATVAAGVLGIFALRGTGEPSPMMTVLLSDRTQAAWTATAGLDGALRLAAFPPVTGGADQPVAANRVLQVWGLPQGATAPTSLALLPPGQRSATIAAPALRPVPGMLIEISLEPPGGSTLGRPSGPVLFIGRLSQPGPPV
jgi:anti-sigma-K factor RskA